MCDKMDCDMVLHRFWMFSSPRVEWLQCCCTTVRCREILTLRWFYCQLECWFRRSFRTLRTRSSWFQWLGLVRHSLFWVGFSTNVAAIVAIEFSSLGRETRFEEHQWVIAFLHPRMEGKKSNWAGWWGRPNTPSSSRLLIGTALPSLASYYCY